MDITIKKEDHNLFIVKINSKNNSIHRVILKDDLHNHLTKGKISKEELIKLSFQFLLQRESNTSILSSFELKMISNYFPEYEKEIILKIKE
jgi:hypothetical protein|tara:strand:- start:464 stop:736 length:273 start_codon:yes stop_codon:yes gene_type:complete